MPSFETMTDESLFSLMKLDEEEAFEEIYERYFDLLYLHARRKLRDAEEARDVVQDVFATFWSKRHGIELTNSLSAYLYVSVRNRVLNFIAHKKIESTYLDSLEKFIEKGNCQMDHLVRTNQFNSMIEQEVSALPSRMREIFDLSRKKFLSHKEIALQLNLSEQTVKKQVTNALKTLRNKLGLA